MTPSLTTGGRLTAHLHHFLLPYLLFIFFLFALHVFFLRFSLIYLSIYLSLMCLSPVLVTPPVTARTKAIYIFLKFALIIYCSSYFCCLLYSLSLVCLFISCFSHLFLSSSSYFSSSLSLPLSLSPHPPSPPSPLLRLLLQPVVLSYSSPSCIPAHPHPPLSRAIHSPSRLLSQSVRA